MWSKKPNGLIDGLPLALLVTCTIATVMLATRDNTHVPPTHVAPVQTCHEFAVLINDTKTDLECPPNMTLDIVDGYLICYCGDGDRLLVAPPEPTLAQKHDRWI